LTKGVGSDTNSRDRDRVKIEVDLEGGVVMAARTDISGCEVSTKRRRRPSRVWRADEVGAKRSRSASRR
jgi:hypothetical protein